MMNRVLSFCSAQKDGGALPLRAAADLVAAESSRWHCDDEARRAVYNNRVRLLSGVAERRSNFAPNWLKAASRCFSVAAACLAARSGKHPQALPDPCCWVQPGVDHAAFDPRGNAPGDPHARFGHALRVFEA
jgi:hypothetical protein